MRPGLARAQRLILATAERTVEDDADGGWTETTSDAVGSSGGGSSAVDDAVDSAAGGMAAVCVADEVDLDDIPDADDDAAAVSVSFMLRTRHISLFHRLPSLFCSHSLLFCSHSLLFCSHSLLFCSHSLQVVVAARDDGAADQVVVERTRT
jgi:hypothetical protein